jgi:hypothetical protein
MPNRQPPNSINIGSQANSGTGDNLRDAFTKVNSNFTDIYASAIFQADLLSNLTVDLIPQIDLTYNIGNSTHRWKDLYVQTINTTNLSNTLTNFTFAGGSMHGTLELIGTPDFFPTIGIKNLNSATIAFHDNHTPGGGATTGVYNYTSSMDNGFFKWSVSSSTTIYDYGHDIMLLDKNGTLAVTASVNSETFMHAGSYITATSDVYAGQDIIASRDINVGHNITATNNIYAGNDIYAVGNIRATGEVTAASDARLKTNVQTIENALDKTRQLRGVTFDKDGKNSLGVIAQEVQKILPQVVIEGDDENKTLSVAYGNIVGLLIEAVKELTDKVEHLEKLIGK